MTEATALARRHRRTILALMAILFFFLLIIDGLIIFNQRNILLTQAHKQVRHELDLLGMLVSEALIKGDYATVEIFVAGWGNQRKNLINASVVLDNGFVLAQFTRTTPDAIPEKYQHDIPYGNERKISIEITENMSDIYALLWVLTVKLTMASFLMVVLLGVIVWKVLKVIAIAPLEHEVYEHEQTAIKLQDYATDLKSGNSELESFSYSVSHDLRAPLRAIDGFSQLLQEDYAHAFDDRANDYLHRIRLGAQRMSILIDDMLQLSRISRRNMIKHPVNLSILAQEAIVKYQALDPHRQVEIQIDPDMIVYGDKFLLTQMLDNLISNAWKYTSKTKHAEIHIGETITDDNKVFFVKDNGVGFDMRYVDKLFGVFQRLHSNDQFEGTGVGLATVKRIILRHEGTVWAESEEGKGSTFYFTLPNGHQKDNHPQVL